MKRSGFAPIVVLIAVAVIAVAGVGGYFVFSKKDVAQSPSALNSGAPGGSIDEPVLQADEKKIAPAILGFWKFESAFFFNSVTKSWVGGSLPEGSPLYMDFKDDGTFCGAYVVKEGYRCADSYTYKVVGDTIETNQFDPSGSPYRYHWKVAEGKLELVAEISNKGEWQPFVKYVFLSSVRPPVAPPTES